MTLYKVVFAKDKSCLTYLIWSETSYTAIRQCALDAELLEPHLSKFWKATPLNLSHNEPLLIA